MTEEQIKRMADRFLHWKLPKDFHPDCGIKFEPLVSYNETYDHDRHGPVGTNLLTASQALEMVRFIVGDDA